MKKTETTTCLKCGDIFTYEWTGHRRRSQCDKCRTPRAKMKRRREKLMAPHQWMLQPVKKPRDGKRDTFSLPKTAGEVQWAKAVRDCL